MESMGLSDTDGEQRSDMRATVWVSICKQEKQDVVLIQKHIWLRNLKICTLVLILHAMVNDQQQAGLPHPKYNKRQYPYVLLRRIRAIYHPFHIEAVVTIVVLEIEVVFPEGVQTIIEVGSFAMRAINLSTRSSVGTAPIL
jgi:hypothetical protein